MRPLRKCREASLAGRRRGGFPFCSQSENHPGLAISGCFAAFYLIARPPLLAVMQGRGLRSIPIRAHLSVCVAAVAAVYQGVNEVESSVIPSLHHRKEGWPSD